MQHLGASISQVQHNMTSVFETVVQLRQRFKLIEAKAR